MPLSVTANYRAKHDARVRVPHYMVTFTRAGVSYATHKVGTVTKKYLQIPTGFAATIEPEMGRSSIGSFSFELIGNAEVTALVATGVGGDTVTLYDGFERLAPADYAIRDTGIITSVKMTNGGYEFECMTPDTLLNRQVFEPAVTALSSFMSAVVNGAAVVDTSLFQDSGYIAIDHEIIQYTGKTDTTLTGFTRGVRGTIAAGHAANAAVTEVIHLGPAHPFDIADEVMMNTDKTGCGIYPSYIDVVGIAAVKADIDSSNPVPGEPYQMEFWITASENAKDFIEQEILSPMSCYRVMTSGGLISYKQFRQPTAFGTETIDHDSILGDDNNPLHLSWDENLQSVLNSGTYEYDFDVLTGEFKAKTGGTGSNLESTASIAKFGKRPFVIRSRGIRSEFASTPALIALRAGAQLNRYKDSAPKIEVETYLRKGLVEPGDIVRLSSSVIPNRLTLERGVEDALMEVVGRTLNFDKGTVSFTLLWTGFGLASVWAPDDVTEDWADATQLEREQYVYLADEDGLNGGSIPGKRYGF